jgi:hypothetical protein
MLAISELVQKGERRQETFSMNAGHFQDAVRAVREREGTSGC